MGGGGLIPPMAVLAGLLLAFWDAWRLLIGRYESGVDAIPLLLVTAAVAVPLARRSAAGAAPFPLRVDHAIAALAMYIAALLWTPPLVRIAVAAVSLMLVLQMMGSGRRARAPFAGLVVLALPVLPSFEFFLAYPLRVASAAITAVLLRMNGFPVEVEGVALRWGETLVQFDAACSGVRMLWGALFLASALAFLAKLPDRRYLLLVGAAIPLTIFANALRAASLFYVEADAAAITFVPAAHGLIGVAAFAMLAAALVSLGHRLRPAR
jgi:exosortase